MMKKILSIEQAIQVSKELKNEGKTIVLVGGFFDILHIGHIEFLEKAKNQGKFLFVLLESDKKAKLLKGENRPINSQKERAIVLSALQSVDYVITLAEMTKDEQYDKLIFQIKPDIIAITQGDPYLNHKKIQAVKTGAKIMEVIKRIEGQSTTRLARLIDNKTSE